MDTRPYVVSAALFAVGLACALTVRAECVSVLPLRDELLRQELLFSARVIDQQPSGDHAVRTTFEVARVWKGSVPRRIEVYTTFSGNDPSFGKGQLYAVVANRVKGATDRRQLGITDDAVVAYRAPRCVFASVEDFIRDFGPGQPPE